MLCGLNSCFCASESVSPLYIARITYHHCIKSKQKVANERGLNFARKGKITHAFAVPRSTSPHQASKQGLPRTPKQRTNQRGECRASGGGKTCMKSTPNLNFPLRIEFSFSIPNGPWVSFSVRGPWLIRKSVVSSLFFRAVLRRYI